MTQDEAKLTDTAGNHYYRPQDAGKVTLNSGWILDGLWKLFLSAVFDNDRIASLNLSHNGRAL